MSGLPAVSLGTGPGLMPTAPPDQSVRRLRLSDPALLPGQTFASVTDRVAAIVLRQKAFLWWWIAVLLVMPWVTAFLVGIAWVFIRGPGIYGLDWPAMWGFDIIDYVWWIGIGCGAAFISSLFYILDADWRAGVGRLADTIAVFGAAASGVFPIIHLGRPWLFYWLYPYPNMQGYWPNWRSPLLWDFWGIQSFLIAVGSFWLLGLIPDFAALRDRAPTRGRAMMYGVLAMGFRGSARQWRHHRAASAALAVVVLIAACDTHSIAALDFAGGATVGWHTTQMPPYFLFGAVLSGAAMILFVGLPLRRMLRLADFITGRHADMLCRIIITSSLLITYAYAMEAFMSWYGADAAERTMFANRVMGDDWYIYWGTVLFNCVLPQLFWVRPLRMFQPLVWLISFLVLVGMWMDPYKLIPVGLLRSRLPSAWGHYHGSWFDWVTLIGSIGFFLFLILLAVRFLPMVGIHNVRRLVAGRGK